MTRALKALTTAFAAALFIAPLNAEVRKAPGLSETLRGVFSNWTEAMAEGDTALWQKTTAQYRQNGMRNFIVSQKKKWPDAIFDMLVSPPDMSKMKLARVMEKGVTAQLVFYGPADFGIEADDIPNGLVFLMFVKQRDGWKFNTLRYMSLADAGEVGDEAEAGLFEFLDAPEFQPPGSVPPLPKLCPVPDLVGFVEIVSIGYETVVKIADRSEHTVIDNVQNSLIIGGLKTGVNPISVKVKPLPLAPGAAKDTKRHFEFTVFRQTPNPDEPLKPIYSSGPKENPGNFKVIVRGNG